MIYADFESILVSEDNEKQNPEESYTKNHQKHITSSYSYKLVCVDHKSSKVSLYSMIEKNEYCSDMMKTHFNKELVMTRERDEDFENSTNCWICYND